MMQERKINKFDLTKIKFLFKRHHYVISLQLIKINEKKQKTSLKYEKTSQRLRENICRTHI